MHNCDNVNTPLTWNKITGTEQANALQKTRQILVIIIIIFIIFSHFFSNAWKRDFQLNKNFKCYASDNFIHTAKKNTSVKLTSKHFFLYCLSFTKKNIYKNKTVFYLTTDERRRKNEKEKISIVKNKIR